MRLMRWETVRLRYGNANNNDNNERSIKRHSTQQQQHHYIIQMKFLIFAYEKIYYFYDLILYSGILEKRSTKKY
jgi:hypothetical protein